MGLRNWIKKSKEGSRQPKGDDQKDMAVFDYEYHSFDLPTQGISTSWYEFESSLTRVF